jgi:hypothetical protein
MLHRDVDHIGRRLFDWGAIAAAPLIPLTMTIWSDQTGLLQRVLFAVGFAWHGTEALRSLQADPTPHAVASDPPP